MKGKVKTSTKIAAFGAALVLVAAVLFTIGMTLLDWQFTELDDSVWESKTYETEKDITALSDVNIICDNANVQIDIGEKLDIEYEESQRTEYRITVDGSTLNIVEKKKFGFRLFDFHTPQIKIVLPRVASLKVVATNLRIESHEQQLFTRLDITAVNSISSLTKIEVAETAKIHTVNGSILLSQFKAKELKAENTNGKVCIVNSSVNVLNAETVNGPIEIGNVTAKQASFKTVNGKIRIGGDVMGAETEYGLTADTLKAKTVNGDITAKRVKIDGLHASTVNGDIEISIEDYASDWRLDCSSVNGDVKAMGGNNGSKEAAASTVNGDIEIKFVAKITTDKETDND